MTAVTALRLVRPEPPLRTVVGVGAVLAVLGICAAGCALLAGNIAAGAPADDGAMFWSMQVSAALAYGALGGWLVARRRAGPLGPLFLLVGASQALALLGREYGVHGLQVAPLPLDRWVFWASGWVWVPGFLGLFLLVPLLLPDGALPSRRWWPAVVVVAASIAVTTLAWAVRPYDVTTAQLGRRLGAAVTPDQLTTVVLPEILAGVVQALQLQHLSLVLADGRAFSSGPPVPAPVELPLRHAGQLVGLLRAAPARGGLTRAERRALTDIAAHAAVAVHGVLLMGELQRERERVVLAREEERRRLRRELHDGVGTALAAACLQAESAHDLMGTHPDEGRALLERLTVQLREAVVDVRAVTRDLRPAMVDDLGLAGALRELGARSTCAERPVDVAVGELGEVPAAVEVAAYRVVAELVANACRHSGASRVRVPACRHGVDLLVRVADDGCGIGPTAVAGVGLDSVRRRVEELGGRLTRGDGPGTAIEARLPLEAR